MNPSNAILYLIVFVAITIMFVCLYTYAKPLLRMWIITKKSRQSDDDVKEIPPESLPAGSTTQDDPPAYEEPPSYDQLNFCDRQNY